MIAYKEPKYRWENRVTIADRQLAVLKYLEGYAVNQIAKWLCVSNTTIEYHLQTQRVYTPFRKATMFVETSPLPCRLVPNLTRSLTLTAPSTPRDNADYYFDEFGERYKRPKSYAQILRQAANIQRLKQSNSIEKQQEAKPTGFLIRVSLSSGNAVIRNKDGIYEFIQAQNNSYRYSVSNSTISY